jgi:uncharacterized protein involved in outer membrane biogenesis
MKYLLNRFIQFILALSVIGILGFIALITLVDPNQFKETIQNNILIKTGRTLDIVGAIRWKIKNGLAIEVDNLKLKNKPPHSEEYIAVKHLSVIPHFWSMASGELTFTMKLTGISFSWVAPVLTHLPAQGMLQGEIQLTLQKQNLDGLILYGYFEGEQLEIGTQLFSKVKFDVYAKKGVLLLPKYEFTTVKGGKHCGMLKVGFDQDSTSFTLNDEGTGIAVNELLTNLGQPQRVEGIGTLKLSLMTLGNTLEEIKKNLSGYLIFSASTGKIPRLSLSHLLSEAQNAITRTQEAFRKNKELDVAEVLNKELATIKPDSESSTEFDFLTANLYFEKGILHNPTLILQCPHYTVKGKGTLDLIKNILNYQSDIELRDEAANGSLQRLKGNPLTISLSGNPENPTMNFGFQHLLKSIPKKAPHVSTLKSLENLFETE